MKANKAIQHSIAAYQQFLHKSAQTVKNNSDELDNVEKPDCDNYQEEEKVEEPLPEIKLPVVKKKKLRKSKSKKRCPAQSAHKGRHLNCKACNSLERLENRFKPEQDHSKLEHFTKLYSQHVS